jgi:basic membrane lipoprotein Med (substrate-binding protein (PBP1-ABC) superfamily)
MDGRKAITKMAAIVIGVIIVVAVIGAGYYAYYSGSGGQSSQTKIYKIAYVDMGPASSSWVVVNRLAMLAAAASLNATDYPIETSFYSDVKEANMQQLVESLAQNNYSLINIGGGFLDLIKNTLGPKYPNTQFLLQTMIFTPTANVGAINLVIYPGYYAAGLAAGYASSTHKVGFITAFKAPILAGAYNAYALGAQAAYNDTEVLVVVANDWADSSKGAASTDSLIGLGCDVIAAFGDGMSTGAIIEAQTKGIYSIGYLFNSTSIAPNSVLLSVAWNPQSTYHDIIYAGLKGALQ